MLLTPSGGLVYHARAWRYRGTLWGPFRRSLAAWLERHLPIGDELILVGPSAGHCLPIEQLRRARKLLVLEPDALARRLLAGRFEHRAVHFESRDLLLGPLLAGGTGIEAVLARFPRAAVLFCNVLGQLHFGLSDQQERRFREEFRRRVWPALAGRAWASFHDRWSLDRDAGAPGVDSVPFDQLPTDEQLAEAFFGDGQESVTALDHGTTRLFPEALPRHYLSWQITPRALHLVEAVAGESPR